MYYTPLQLYQKINSHDSSYKYVLTRVENCVGPGQLASQKPADLDLHNFQNSTYLVSARGEFNHASARCTDTSL